MGPQMSVRPIFWMVCKCLGIADLHQSPRLPPHLWGQDQHSQTAIVDKFVKAADAAAKAAADLLKQRFMIGWKEARVKCADCLIINGDSPMAAEKVVDLPPGQAPLGEVVPATCFAKIAPVKMMSFKDGRAVFGLILKSPAIMVRINKGFKNTVMIKIAQA